MRNSCLFVYQLPQLPELLPRADGWRGLRWRMDISDHDGTGVPAGSADTALVRLYPGANALNKWGGRGLGRSTGVNPTLAGCALLPEQHGPGPEHTHPDADCCTHTAGSPGSG